MTKAIILMALLSVMLVGCATLSETLQDIAAGPATFNQEVADATSKAKAAVPELPDIMLLGIGYAAAFLRRWYKNIKQEQASSLKLTDIGKG